MVSEPDSGGEGARRAGSVGGGVADEELLELVRRVQAGSREAFEALFQLLRPHFLRNARRWAHGAEVDDLLQNIFIEVFKSLPKYRFESRIKTWMYRVAIRAAMRFWEKRRRDAAMFDLGELGDGHRDDGGHSADDELQRAEEGREVHRILATLSPKRRMVLVLSDLEGRSSSEVAILLGTNAFTVRTRLYYARKEFAARAKESPVFCSRYQIEKSRGEHGDIGGEGFDAGAE